TNGHEDEHEDDDHAQATHGSRIGVPTRAPLSHSLQISGPRDRDRRPDTGRDTVTPGLNGGAPLMRKCFEGLAVVGSAVAWLVGSEGRALAAGPANCSGFTGPKIVVESGDTQEPLLKALGQKLANSTTPLRVLYVLKGTCTLADDLYKGLKLPLNTNIKYAPTT